MSLDNLLQKRLDVARVAIFDLLQALQSVCDFEAVVVYKLDPQKILKVEAVARAVEDRSSSIYPDLGETKNLEGSLEEDVVALRSFIVVPDTIADSHFRERGEISGVRAFIGFPMVISGGVLYGVISAYHTTPRAVSKPAIAVARAISRSVALELEVASAIEATFAGKANPFEVLKALGSVSSESALDSEPDQWEAVSNATKIVSAAYGFDLKSSLSRTHPFPIEVEPEPDEEPHTVWPADVDSVVSKAGSLLPSLPGARIDVYPGSESLVDLDSKSLERILANVMLHIWRSSPPGTPISVSSLREGDWIEISIEDKSGVFPVESLARRAHPAGSRRIGLPIATALVEEAGGRLTQMPTEDGRRYVVRLPSLRDGGNAQNGPGGKDTSAKGA